MESWSVPYYSPNAEQGIIPCLQAVRRELIPHPAMGGLGLGFRFAFGRSVTSCSASTARQNRVGGPFEDQEIADA
jgi:hypothetical protein